MVFICTASTLLVYLKRHADADAFIKPNARIIKAGNILWLTT